MVTAPVAETWASDLADITLTEATAAARDHYRESTDWLMPAHIVRRVRAERRGRQTMSEEVPQDCGAHLWVVDGTCAKCLTLRRDVDPAWAAEWSL